MAVKKKNSLWKYLSLLVVLALGGMVAYDIKLHGSFKASTVGRTLQDTGALAYGNLALEQAKIYTRKGAVWTRVNGPIYYASAVEVSKPYIQLSQDLGITAFNGMSKALIGVDSWCTKTAPELTVQVKEYAAIAGQVTLQFAIDVARYAKLGLDTFHDYAAENIFVGKWSAENLQKLSENAVNVTQQYIITTYEWLVEQVDSLDKAR